MDLFAFEYSMLCWILFLKVEKTQDLILIFFTAKMRFCSQCQIFREVVFIKMMDLPFHCSYFSNFGSLFKIHVCLPPKQNTCCCQSSCSCVVLILAVLVILVVLQIICSANNLFRLKRRF